MQPDKMPPIRVRESVYRDLVSIAGRFQSLDGRTMTLGEVVTEAKNALIEKRPELAPEAQP